LGNVAIIDAAVQPNLERDDKLVLSTSAWEIRLTDSVRLYWSIAPETLNERHVWERVRGRGTGARIRDASFPGTYYLAFHDLPDLMRRYNHSYRALDFGCGTG
jgi:hypothetical protein